MRSIGLLILILLASPSPADQPVFSGPQVGESLPAFEALGVYDDLAGQEIDPIQRAGDKPLILVFVHQLTRPGIALTRGLTNYASELGPEKLAANIIWLTADKAEAEQYLNRARRSLNLSVPVAISTDGIEGPGAYGLNRNVELTVLIGKKNNVTANFALVQPSLSDAPAIATEIAKAAGVDEPSAEQLAKLAHPNAPMQNRMRDTGSPRQSTDRETNPRSQLRGLMKTLLASQGSDAKRTEAVTRINEWVGDSKERRAARAKMATAVLERGMGDEQTQQLLRQWQSDAASAATSEEP